MSLLTAQFRAPAQEYAMENLLSLRLQQRFNSSHMKMHLHTQTVNTSELPRTRAILQKFLPSVLESKCFNENNLPFSEEVTHTEIGHLFEHILLEYLCLLRISRGSKYAVYNGVTNWNWLKNPRGTFEIKVDTGYKDSDIFPEAMSNSLCLLELILKNSHLSETLQSQLN